MDKRFIILSDSLGGTAKQLLKATISQFDYPCSASEVFSGISSEQDLDRIIERIDPENDFLLSTIVKEDLQKYLDELTEQHNLFVFDAMNPLLSHMETFLGKQAVREPGVLHKLDVKYFNRVEAIEFAVKYDDGKNIDGIKKADIVLLGISRTSKTPLSMYLANLSYKVCNIPIVPEVDVPEEIFAISPKKIIGLTNNVDVLMNIRRNRLKSMGFDVHSSYSDAQRIEDEIAYADRIYKKIGCTIINVADTSIEENAVKIIKYYQEKNK